MPRDKRKVAALYRQPNYIIGGKSRYLAGNDDSIPWDKPIASIGRHRGREARVALDAAFDFEIPPSFLGIVRLAWNFEIPTPELLDEADTELEEIDAPISVVQFFEQWQSVAELSLPIAINRVYDRAWAWSFLC